MLSEQQTQTLEQLSAAATQGELHHCGWGDGSTQMGMTNIFNEHSEVLLVECIPEPDAAFIVALWNAYRTGQLVAVQPDDATVERVAARMYWGDTGDDWDQLPEIDMDKRQYRWRAEAAIATMKGPKP